MSPKPIVIAEVSYNRKQREGERVAQYIAELRNLTEHCEFGAFLKEALRDMFVIGLKDTSVQKKLLSERSLDLKTAYEKALSHEMAEQKVEEMQGAVHKVFFGTKSRPRPNHEKSKCCFRCGKENYAAENCFFRNKECHSCHRKGHVSSQCNKFSNKESEKKKSREGSKKKLQVRKKANGEKGE